MARLWRRGKTVIFYWNKKEWAWIGAQAHFAMDGWQFNFFGIGMFIVKKEWWRK